MSFTSHSIFCEGLYLQNFILTKTSIFCIENVRCFSGHFLKSRFFRVLASICRSLRPISNIQLNTSLHLHLCPIYLVVFKGSYQRGISHLEGGFTLRCLQRLSRPDLATLPWCWSPTDKPVVRPSRSSRTKDSSSQISYAHAG